MRESHAPQCLIVVLAFAALLAGGCRSNAAVPPHAAIRIGVIADLSRGPGLQDGQALRATLDSAVSTINESGGIDGRPLEVLYGDPAGDPAEAMARARQLLRDERVDLLYGGTLNSECEAMQELAGWVGVVYLMGNACVDEDLTAKSCNEFSFRLFPTGRQQTDPLATYVTGNIGARWIIVYRDYGPGRSWLKTWQTSLNQAGATVVAAISVPPDAQDISPYLSQIPSDRSLSGVIVAAAGSDEALLLDALRRSGKAEAYPIVAIGNPSIARAPLPIGPVTQITLASSPLSPHPDAELKSGMDANATDLSLTALWSAMTAAHFSGKADTGRLVTALETTGTAGNAGPFAGKLEVDASDHQGRTEENILGISDRGREVLQRIAPNQIPVIGTCHV